MTPAEYLAFERAAEERHEYNNGEVYAMTGEGWEHSVINNNLIGEVHRQIKGGPNQGYAPNLKVGIGPGTAFFYPDLMVTYGRPVTHGDDVLLNPGVIFEVVSPATEARDRGEKFHRYQELESLTDYVLISQSQPWIEHFARREDQRWLCFPYIGLSASLYIKSLNCHVSLADIYEQVEFPPEETEPDSDNPEGA
ncbi:MAG: Uma2 family endonuclease [Blastocatellia bacterium]